MRDRLPGLSSSRPRRAACSTLRSPTGLRTRTSSTGRRAWGSAAPRSGSPASLLGDPGRVERRAHPDLYVLEPLGDQIRIDAIRELHHDLHMRPFEADRRVYLVFGADTLNDEAADALLKDLEEPPPYAVAVLVADDIGPLADTIRSRCQLVPFRRLAEATVRDEIVARSPELSEDEATALARVARGRLDRVDRLLDPEAARRREAVLEVARSVYRESGFQPGEASSRLMAIAGERAEEAKERAQAENEDLDLTGREKEQRTRRAMRGAEREEILLCLEELEAWYRDLVVVAAGAESAAAHFDHLDSCAKTRVSSGSRARKRRRAVRETWRLLRGVPPPARARPRGALHPPAARVRRSRHSGVTASVTGSDPAPKVCLLRHESRAARALGAQIALRARRKCKGV